MRISNIAPKRFFSISAMQLTLLLFMSSVTQAAFAANPPPVQVYYVPLPEDQVLTSLESIYPEDLCDSEHFGPVDPVTTYVSIVAAFDNTILYYDEWEDGYEADISAPVSATTEIWGDNDPANGFPPGYPRDVLRAGDTIVLKNNVATATRQSVIDVDGGDKIAASSPVSFTRAAWADRTETLLAGAVELFEVDKWGTLFELPVGENTESDSHSMFEYTGAAIMASEDHTIVEMDKDGDGYFEDVEVLHQGKSHLIDGGLLSSAVIKSTKNIQVVLISGDICASYETRWYTILPKEQWSGSYYSPVSTNIDDATGLFVYNPDTTEKIQVYLESPHGVQETVVIDPLGTAKIVVPNGSGAHLYSRDGFPFLALAAVDSDENQNSIHDWGFPLIPERMLTQQVLVGWGAGRDPLSTINPNENSSPIWVTPVVPQGNGPVRVCADFNGDNMGAYTDSHGNQYDALFYLRELESAKIYDSDGDQTGMIVYICDDSESKLAAAWGQDPNRASRGEPGVDMGTTIPPLPSFYVLKNNEITIDYNGDGKANPNETITYTIEIYNVSRVPIPDMLLDDQLPDYTSYVPGSAMLNDGTNIIPISDYGNTPYPFDEGGIILGDIPVGGKFTVTFKVILDSFLPAGVTQIYNKAIVRALGEEDEDDTDTPTSNAPAILLDKTLYEGQDGGYNCPGSEVLQVESLTPITYCFVVTNTGDTYLNQLKLVDNDLGIVLQDDTLLAPGESVTLHYETISGEDLVNTAVVTGNPVDDQGNDHVDENDVTDDDTATLKEIPTGYVFGRVFLDKNGKDGPEDGEPGIEGVKVYITEITGRVRELWTDENGNYEVRVVAGRTRAKVDKNTLPKGVKQTFGDDPSFVDVKRNDRTHIGDDGFQPWGIVYGHVFYDLNGKNGKEPGEGGIEGVLVKVYDYLGNLYEDTTNSDGNYEFEIIAGGSATIGAPATSDIYEKPLLDLKYKYTFGTDPSTVDVSWGETVDIGMDGYQPRADVHGFVFKDMDGDRNYNANVDEPFPGVKVTVSDSQNGVYDVWTDASGKYKANVAEGPTTADVDEKPLLDAGYIYTAGEDPNTVNVPRSSDTFLGKDGYQPLGRVYGNVFEELVEDGKFTKGAEPGMKNVRVVVTDRFNKDHELHTNKDGYYEVTVPIGNTKSDIDESTIPPGYEYTVGVDPSFANVTLKSYTHIGDDGYSPYAHVYGTVFKDIENVGVKDDFATTADEGFAGIEVVVEDRLGEEQKVETDIDGYYRVKVRAGKVVATVQDAKLLEQGWRQTYGSNPSTIDAPANSDKHIGDDGYNPPLCEIEVEQFCSVKKVVSANDCNGEVTKMVFAYTGEGCRASDNNQNDAECQTTIKNDGRLGDLANVDLLKDTKFVRNPDTSSKEGHVILSAKNGAFASETVMKINGSNGSQTVLIETSCSQPLRVGDKFGSLRLVELTSTKGGTVTDEPLSDESECSVQMVTPTCDRNAKDRSFTFLYTGNPCMDSTNPQGGKFSCDAGSSDVQLGDFDNITVSNSKDAKMTVDVDGKGRTLVTLESNGGKFPSDTQFKVYGVNGSQTLAIHTSCSQNIAVGDQYGALKLVGINGEQMGVTVDYIYEIQNIGKADVFDLLVSDDMLGFIECGDTLKVGEFKSCKETVTFDEPGQYNSAVEVSGEEIYGRECTATASASVEVKAPPLPPFECNKPINSLTMIWNGSEAVRVEAFDGSVGSRSLGVKNVEPGKEITFGGITGQNNDVQWAIYSQATGRRLGTSMFHVSCSDDDMDGQEDCGKAEGNAKNNGGSLINDWVLAGMKAQGTVLDCSEL